MGGAKNIFVPLVLPVVSSVELKGFTGRNFGAWKAAEI